MMEIPMLCLVMIRRFALRSATSVRSGTPRAKNTHWTSKCTCFNKDGSRKEGIRPHSGAGGDDSGKPRYNNLLSKDLTKNKLKSLKSSRRNTSARRSAVTGEGANTPLTEAPPHPLVMDRITGAAIH